MAEEVWMLQTKKADFKQIGARFRIDPVTARIIRNRGIEGEAAIDRYLNGTLDDLYDPMLLKDMERAVSILCEAVDTGKKIRIVGDYDIDGVCSTYILLQAFERLGSDVDFEIPDRIKDGYGINESIIEQAHADGVEVILTCDNGISAFHQVELAKKYGMTVVITDHHEVPLDGEKEKIPPADAVIDPKQADCPYPFPEICGAVVAYKLVQVLYARRGVPQMEWLDLLEFAAIATVGDVMKLQDENRILVKYGLKKMAQTKNLGLRRLAEKNNLDLGAITAYHIGFVIGPCLNAGGRLKTAKEALALLRAQSEEEAERLAEELKELNDTRKDMTEQGTEAAKLQVESWYQKDKVLTEVAEKRLKAIREFTEFGAGFKVAMRDLEIRGAGNLLGTAQSGHMMNVGYELYCKMVDEAVRALQGEIIGERKEETSVEIPLSAYIPETYIENESLKLSMYKKIASVRTYDDEDEILDELLDRFGDVPQATVNLVQISHARYLAEMLSVTRIYQEKTETAPGGRARGTAGRSAAPETMRMVFQFAQVNPLSGYALFNLTERFGQKAFVHGGVEPFIRLSTDRKNLMKDVLGLLEILNESKKGAGKVS